MIQTSRATSGRGVPQAGPDRWPRPWAALVWGLVWRALVVILLPIVLPSQAQIGSARGGTQRLMVGVVAALAAVCLLGLLLGVWQRRGVLGSLNRVVGAAVLVRLAFLGPIELMMAAWIAAIAVAAVDWLHAVRTEQSARPSASRAPFVAPRSSPFTAPQAAYAPPPTVSPPPPAAPVWTSASPRPYVPPPPWPNMPARRPHRFGRPVVPWFVALTGIVVIALLAWASNPNLNPPSSADQPAPPATSQPAPPATEQPPASPPAAAPQSPSGHRTVYCTTVAESRVCVSVSA
jgi:hypothetical protein